MSASTDRAADAAGVGGGDLAPPLRHAYALNDELIVRPGMVARCGHVRTVDEGVARGDVSGTPLDPCMVCVEMDRAAGEETGR